MAAGVRRAAACPACCTAGAVLRSNAGRRRCPAWRLPTDDSSLHSCGFVLLKKQWQAIGRVGAA